MSIEATRRGRLDARAGTVYLVGAGPGAADLLTVRAVRLLERADIVLHDALVAPEVLGLARAATRIDVGKRCGRHAMPQHEINRLLIAHARAHATVVRLKGGDPMVFGRAEEEIAALAAAAIACEVVPGITSASAAAATLRIPLTRRGDVRAFALCTLRTTSHTPSAVAATQVDAGALYMAGGCLTEAAGALLAAGCAPDTPVAIAQDVSLASEMRWFTSVGALAAGVVPRLAGPAVVLFGPQFAPRTNAPGACRAVAGSPEYGHAHTGAVHAA